jgi:hypothetical protein
MGGPPAWGLGEVLTTPHRKKINHVTKYCKKPRNHTDPSVRWRALVNTVMNLRVPQNAGNFLSSLGRFSFSGRTLLYGVQLHHALQ